MNESMTILVCATASISMFFFMAMLGRFLGGKNKSVVVLEYRLHPEVFAAITERLKTKKAAMLIKDGECINLSLEMDIKFTPDLMAAYEVDKLIKNLGFEFLENPREKFVVHGITEQNMVNQIHRGVERRLKLLNK